MWSKRTECERGRDDWNWKGQSMREEETIGIGSLEGREREREAIGIRRESVREEERWERGRENKSTERTNGRTPYLKYYDRTVDRIRVKLEFKNSALKILIGALRIARPKINLHV